MNYAQFIQIEDGHQGLIDKFDWLKASGIEDYKRKALDIFNLKKFPKKNDSQLIQQIIPRTPKDFEKKELTKSYYISNSICFIDTINWILSAEFVEQFRVYVPEENKDTIVFNYADLFQHILFEGLYNLARYEAIILKRKPEFTGYKNPIHHSIEMHLFAKQIVFGQSSFHAFRDREPDLAVSIIRQMVEIRLRNAFGIYGLYNRKQDIFEPLPMSLIFDILKKYKDKIDLSIPLEDIIRIYGWANIYLHSGLRNEIWKIILSLRYLDTFMTGKKTQAGSSVDWGIETDQSTIKNIHNDLHKLFNNPKGFWKRLLSFAKKEKFYELVTSNPQVKLNKTNVV
ncbi:hypothetical protein [Leptospira neocaledonica]|nr:hypothetical protein [Leptospira neocaledonica]